MDNQETQVMKGYTREELDALNWNEIRSICKEVGVEYTTKDESIRAIMGKTNKYVQAIFVKNYRQYQRGNVYMVSALMFQKLRKLGVIK